MSGILIVEDEKHLADGLRYNLEAEGYSVDAVSDAEAALELLKERPREYDVMVLDVMLPGMGTGFTFAANLRAQGQFVPILMLTARGQAEDVLRGFEAGADDYLPKPFELSVLIARYTRCCDGANGCGRISMSGAGRRPTIAQSAACSSLVAERSTSKLSNFTPAHTQCS